MTEAGVCNLALLRVGQRLQIQALTDNTPEARAARVAYLNAFGVVLEEHPWSFATRYKALALVADATRPGFDYVYACPSDMAVDRYIWSGVLRPANDQAIPYAIVDGDTDFAGPVVATNLEDAELCYTANDINIARFPAKVADAIAWLMVPDLALGLAVKPGMAPTMLNFAMARIREAAAADFNRGQLAVAPESEFVRGR